MANQTGKRALIYARVSSDAQREKGFSIPTQIDACLKYCQNKGYAIVGNSYVDLATGKNTTKERGVCAYAEDHSSLKYNRPVLDEIREYRDSVGFDVLVMYNVDRFGARGGIGFYLRLKDEFEQLGIKIEYVLNNFEGDIGELYEFLSVWHYTKENEDRIERTQRGKLAKQETGKYVRSGYMAYGFTTDNSAENNLAHVPATIKHVIQMYQWYVNDGYSLSEIAKKLNAANIPTATGKGVWNSSTVRRILANPAYKGEMINNRWTKENGKLAEKPKEDWHIIPVEPAIDKATFDKAQELLKTNKKNRRKKTHRFYLVSRRIVCSECGRIYAAQTKVPTEKNKLKNEERAYRHRKLKNHCLNRTISAKKLDEMVWSKIVEILQQPQLVIDGYKQAVKQSGKRGERIQKTLDKLLEENGKNKVKKERLLDLYLSGETDKQTYLNKLSTIQTNIEAIETEITQLQDELKNLPTIQGLENIKEFSHTIAEFLTDEPTNEDKAKILEFLHVQVLVDADGTIRLTGWFDTSGKQYVLYQTTAYTIDRAE